MRSGVMHAEYKAMARCKKSLRLWNNAAVRLHSAALGAVDCRQVDERPTCAADITLWHPQVFCTCIFIATRLGFNAPSGDTSTSCRPCKYDVERTAGRSSTFDDGAHRISIPDTAIGACAAVVGEHQLEHREMYAVTLEMVAWVFFLLGESL